MKTSVPQLAAEKAMSGVWQRMQMVANNIANEDTPGYKAKRLSFESMLKKEIRSLGRNGGQDAQQRIGRLEPRVHTDRNLVIRADGNNVDIDSEHIEMARVQMQYQALTQKVGGHYALLKAAINGGR